MKERCLYLAKKKGAVDTALNRINREMKRVEKWFASRNIKLNNVFKIPKKGLMDTEEEYAKELSNITKSDIEHQYFTLSKYGRVVRYADHVASEKFLKTRESHEKRLLTRYNIKADFRKRWKWINPYDPLESQDAGVLLIKRYEREMNFYFDMNPAYKEMLDHIKEYDWTLLVDLITSEDVVMLHDVSEFAYVASKMFNIFDKMKEHGIPNVNKFKRKIENYMDNYEVDIEEVNDYASVRM